MGIGNDAVLFLVFDYVFFVCLEIGLNFVLGESVSVFVI